MQPPYSRKGQTAKFARVILPPPTKWGRDLFYEIDRQLCVVCYRVSDKPTPKVASRQHQCAGCGATIWVARKSPATPPKVCIQCVRR